MEIILRATTPGSHRCNSKLPPDRHFGFVHLLSGFWVRDDFQIQLSALPQFLLVKFENLKNLAINIDKRAISHGH